jgi:peptidyl-tRNA hydrolase, PTH1 family
MIIIVGLGNPGKKYTNTRHNVGWMILDTLTGKIDWKENTNAQAFIYTTELENKEVEFLKPNIFMNNSGIAVAYALKKHPSAKLIVVHDDKDISLGKIKIQTDRSAAGHNGVKSIIEHIGTQNFIRVRVGIAPKDPSLFDDTADFVLDKFTKEEKDILNQAIEDAVQEIHKLLIAV